MELFLAPFWVPKVVQKRVSKSYQKWNQFWNHSLRISEVGKSAKPAFCEAVGKVPGGWKSTQKKGRDEALKYLTRHLRAL